MFYLRILQLYYIHRRLGPKVVVIWRMVCVNIDQGISSNRFAVLSVYKMCIHVYYALDVFENIVKVGLNRFISYRQEGHYLDIVHANNDFTETALVIFMVTGFAAYRISLVIYQLVVRAT